MKNLFLFSLFSLLLFSCSKLTESNIVGTWELTSFTSNGVSNLPTYTVTIKFENDNTTTVYGDGAIITLGNYSVDKSNQTLTIDNTVYDVIEKKGNKMTLQLIINGFTLLYIYEKQ